MTIAAGFVCTDGVVLCADTQESYGEDKTHVYKLVPMTGVNWVGAVAGAGVGYFIDYAYDKILETLDKFKPGTTPEAIRKELEKLFAGLYKNEFRIYPQEVEKSIQILVGLCDKSKSKTYLFSIDSTLVRHIDRERVIGTGELLKQLANDFQKMKLNLSKTMWVAMYLVWDAKRRYTDVGGLFRQRNFRHRNRCASPTCRKGAEMVKAGTTGNRKAA